MTFSYLTLTAFQGNAHLDDLGVLLDWGLIPAFNRHIILKLFFFIQLISIIYCEIDFHIFLIASFFCGIFFSSSIHRPMMIIYVTEISVEIQITRTV